MYLDLVLSPEVRFCNKKVGLRICYSVKVIYLYMNRVELFESTIYTS